MDTPVTVAVIAGSAAIVAPAVSIYLFYLTKRKERDADWQKYKFEQYREFVVALSGTVGTDSTPDGNRRFAVACNTLHLLAPKAVIDCLHKFQDEIAVSNPNKSRKTHDALLARLIWEIRTDLRIPVTPALGDLKVGLWCSGAADNAVPSTSNDVEF